MSAFSNIVNPFSVNQFYQDSDCNVVNTGDGYAVIVRLTYCKGYQFTGAAPYISSAAMTTPTTLAGIPVANWEAIGGQPSDPSFTAFFSQDDYINSDLIHLGGNPQLWEVGQSMSYFYETSALTALNQVYVLEWEIIEVVDKTTYNAGLGVPTGSLITQATYAEIPVGTITATPGTTACNGCSTIYNEIGIPSNQGLVQMATPGHTLEYSGTLLLNSIDAAFPVIDGDTYQLQDGLFAYSRGFYIGSFAVIQAHTNTNSCRNPLAKNFDLTTTEQIINTSFNNPAFANMQKDCNGVNYVPGTGTYATNNGYGDESCCLFPIDDAPGCGPVSGSGGGCIDPNAVNWDPNVDSDCNNVVAGNDDSCCDYFYEWKFCGATYLFNGPTHVNFTGDLSNYSNPAPNTPDTNVEFMEYWINIQNSPYSTINDVPIGTVMRMRSISMPGQYACYEYLGPQSDTAVANHGSDGVHYNSNSWWNYPISTDGANDFEIMDDCNLCLNPAAQVYYYTNCDTGEVINIVNSWATNPFDEDANALSPNQEIFSNAMGSNVQSYNCTNCNQQWMLNGMILNLDLPILDSSGVSGCWRVTGGGPIIGTDIGGWIEGVGAGTDNFIIVDADDTDQVLSIEDNCNACVNFSPPPTCTGICYDSTALNYVTGPYNTSQCDCNGEQLGANNPGWNSCCTYCDGNCNDVDANNYDPAGLGCCQGTPCCTYNWRCDGTVPAFNQSWPNPVSNLKKSQVLREWDKHFGITATDTNPRPTSGWEHTKDSGYTSDSLVYLNTSLRFLQRGGLGLNLNDELGGQGWGSGKQPNAYLSTAPSQWNYATDFMNDITGSGSGSRTTPDGTFLHDMDLTKSYYKVKTNMVSVIGGFKNSSSKVITEPIVGGTTATGLYHHIIPAGSLTIPTGFENTLINTSGKTFTTWNKFISALTKDGMPEEFKNASYTDVSDWVISHVSRFGNNDSNNNNAAPRFYAPSVQFMVTAATSCVCIEDASGIYSDENQCETILTVPSGSGIGTSNCCACIYGCTDPQAFNYDPTATCDDGSCLDCEPIYMRRCNNSTTYYQMYLGDNTLVPQTCANSTALIAAFGFTSYTDVIHLDYTFSLNTDPNPLNQDIDDCWQWIDPLDPDFILHGINANMFIHTDLALPNPGLTQTLTPWNGTDTPDEACSTCGDEPGCTDSNAMNYDINANVDDGSCIYCVYGCMGSGSGSAAGEFFSDINGYAPGAVYDCANSTTIPTSGTLCTSGSCSPGYIYSNYDPCSTCDDGTCVTPTYHDWKLCGDATTLSITAPNAPNDYASQESFYQAVGSPVVGETINTVSGQPAANTCYAYIGPSATNTGVILSPLPMLVDWVSGQSHNSNCNSCTCIYGCTDPAMCNYDAAADCDDGSCCNLTGCMDSNAFNYCSTCCCSGPCTAIVLGCMDINANNFDPLANTQCNYCCDYTVVGCTNPTAVNYNPLANTESVPSTCSFLDQCKRQPREFGSNPTKKLDVECSFASDVYKEYRKERYGLSNYCGSDLPDHLNQKVICDWEDSKRPAYLSSILTVVDKYSYPIVDGEYDWFDTLRPIWTSYQCGLKSDVDIDMYFNYDTTSMGLLAIQNQRQAIEAWIAGMAIKFGGNIYHTLVFGERWLDWGTAILTGVWNNSGSCGGVGTGCTPGAPVDHGNCPSASSASDAVTITNMNASNKFWQAVGWGNTTSRDFYAAMPDTVTNGSLNHLGFPPQLSKSQVLCVNFADESAAGTAVGLEAQPYHISPGPATYGTAEWYQGTDGTGTATNASTRAGSDSTITPCWKADYDFWIQEYKKHLLRGSRYKATMVIYPCKPIGAAPTLNSQTAFPLHVLGGVDSGNNIPKDGMYFPSSRPQNDLVDLKRIEEGNPYWNTTNPNQPASHTFGYGGLDNYGWIANVRERAFDAAIFKAELEQYWDPNRLVCDGSECITINVVNQNNVAIPDYDIYLDGGFAGKTDEFGRVQITIPNAGVKTNHIINLCLCLTTTGNCSQQNVKITVDEECAPECCAEPTGVSCDTYVSPTQRFEGCTDANASNYNPIADYDDGTCLYCDPAIIITETHVNVSAAGASDGSITTTITNGSIPLTFLWSNGATTQNLSGIAGGLYTLTVTDNRACTAIIIVRVNEDPDIYGCTTSTAGYWPNINGLNQAGVTCTYPCSDDNTDTGVMEGYQYFCYDPDATKIDDCCEAGCTDSSATNTCASCDYDCNLEDINAAGYTQNLGWDSCCQGCVYGCMNVNAGNYDPLADCDDNSCIFYFSCTEAGYEVNEVLNGQYTLSTINQFDDTTCQAGNCDSSWFFSQLAEFYSTQPNDILEPATELTMVNSVGYQSSMSFLWWDHDCPGSTLNPAYSDVMPLGTIGGYTTENPYGPTAASSCYQAQQILDFGNNYIFPSWEAYRDWHNNGINGSQGPNFVCSGTQIPILINTDTFSTAIAAHVFTNTPSDDPYDPQPEDNWVYYTSNIPECSNFTDCACEEVFDTVGDYETSSLCEDDTSTCCGAVVIPQVGGCIDNGYVEAHPDFGAQGATTAQEWWNGMNGAGQNYALANIQMLTCVNGITPINQIGNGGTGTYGTGSQPNYPAGVAAYNYDPAATFDDGSCCYCQGCSDPGTLYPEPGACDECDSCCVLRLDGCTDPAAANYYGSANMNDNSCLYLGCLDSLATNYGTFEINGLTSYTWDGYTYGFGSIQGSCAGCCDTAPQINFECIGTPLNNPVFFNDGTQLTDPLDFLWRVDMSTIYECPSVAGWPQGGCQTLSDRDDYITVQVMCAVGIWGRAVATDAYAEFDKWFFWLAHDFSPQPCDRDQGEMDSLYAQTNWQAPSGQTGFTITNVAITNSTPMTYARPKIITHVIIKKTHSSFADVNINMVSVGDPDTSFIPFRDQAIINDVMDGTGSGPNIVGKTYDEIWTIFNTWAVGADGYSYHIEAVFAEGQCGTSEEKMCLRTANGTYNTCSQCASTNCGICV